MDIASWTPRCNSHCGGRYTRIQHSIAFNWLSSYCCLGSRDLWHGTKRAYKPQNPLAWKIEKLCRHTVRIAFKVQHHESLVLQSLAHCFFCGLPRPQNTSFILNASFCRFNWCPRYFGIWIYPSCFSHFLFSFTSAL